MGKLLRVFAFLLVIYHLIPVNGSTNVEAKTYSEHNTPAKVGLVAASVVSTIVYFPCKLSYAVIGGITSGLAYGVTLGKEAETANDIAIGSFYGDWYIHPKILTSEEELNFIGPDDVSP